MILSDIVKDIRGIDTSSKKIRDFGITFFVVLVLVGGVFLYKGRDFGYLFMALGLFFLCAGLWAKKSLKGLYKVWMALAVVMGFFMSRIILCVLFYGVITPIGTILRVFGKDLLNQKWDRKATTYWIRKERGPFDKKRYEKLF